MPPFVWTLAIGGALFAAAAALFVWVSGAPADQVERLPWIVKVLAYLAGVPLGWLLLVGPVAFVAVLQLLAWLGPARTE